MYVFCLHVNCVNTWYPWRPEEGIRSPATGVTDDCEPPYGFWELNAGPLKEHSVLLTTDPSLAPTYLIFQHKALQVTPLITDAVSQSSK